MKEYIHNGNARIRAPTGPASASLEFVSIRSIEAGEIHQEASSQSIRGLNIHVYSLSTFSVHLPIHPGLTRAPVESHMPAPFWIWVA